MTGPIGHLLVGPRSHGVVRYAQSVFDAVRAESADHRLAHVLTLGAGVVSGLDECALVHVHVTDRLFGRTPRQARDSVLALFAALDRPVSVTLHDLPQPSDGPAMQARADFYRAVARAATGVIVSSHHEASLFAEYVDATIGVEVIPLMFDTVRVDKPSESAELTVGVLGYLYPGKGHLETLQAMSGLDPSIGFVALGTPSPGHEDLADELAKVAAEMGRRCTVTGFLTDDELIRASAEVTVPAAYHRHMSASGSINSWISAGRRPLVPSTAYTDELAARSPGVLTMHANNDAALRTALESAFANPASTWIDPAVTPSPTAADVGRAHERLVRRWSA
ncbi:hypothetical protein PWF70_09570 [Gordonia sp. Swx-4]|uniref:Uncharacterized protein n=1 Tax=Gordonia westfalica TaxID=158898 RepID=A0A1H2IZC2_9ACTN|nr:MULTISPECIES: hypothetical protein [Gordonia]AZZ82650.1 hypothetical protein C5O27_17645 [Gordonia alkanivorans]QGP87897.1 hypothetical protein GKZ92_09710 [Gordonia sp. 135]WJG15212.1 hypothetical protein PWF70_09570 [Gordonia sp. Swx-4]SDU49265.1 hypothetical protein SAMN04488548_1341568 [Gordonia westfalica]